MQNDDENIQREWYGNGQLVVNNIHLGMIRIYPNFSPNHHQWTCWPTVVTTDIGNASVSPKELGSFFKVMGGDRHAPI